MSEELEQQNDGTWSGLKKTIIGVATTAVMGLGTWGVTKITGGGDETPAQAPAQPSIIINNTQQQQQAAGGTKTVIVKEKSSTPAPAPKKKEGDEFKQEAPKW